MKRIARFEKVSFGQFSDGWDDTFQAIEKGENKDQSKETLKEIYDRITLLFLLVVICVCYSQNNEQ